MAHQPRKVAYRRRSWTGPGGNGGRRARFERRGAAHRVDLGMRARWLPGRDGFGRDVPRWLYTRYEPAHWYPDYPESESDDDEDEDEKECDTARMFVRCVHFLPSDCEQLLRCLPKQSELYARPAGTISKNAVRVPRWDSNNGGGGCWQSRPRAP